VIVIVMRFEYIIITLHYSYCNQVKLSEKGRLIIYQKIKHFLGGRSNSQAAEDNILKIPLKITKPPNT